MSDDTTKQQIADVHSAIINGHLNIQHESGQITRAADDLEKMDRKLFYMAEYLRQCAERISAEVSVLDNVFELMRLHKGKTE